MSVTHKLLQDELDKADAELAALKAEITRLRGEVTDELLGAFVSTSRRREALANKLNDSEREELTRLRALLASGQCVDLARVTDVEAGLCAEAACATENYPRVSDGGAALRAWLLEKARVKA